MKERKIGFKQAVNEAIVQGLSTSIREFSTPVFDLGNAKLPVEQALTLAAQLEDEELLRKRALGK